MILSSLRKWSSYNCWDICRTPEENDVDNFKVIVSKRLEWSVCLYENENTEMEDGKARQGTAPSIEHPQPKVKPPKFSVTVSTAMTWFGEGGGLENLMLVLFVALTNGREETSTAAGSPAEPSTSGDADIYEGKAMKPTSDRPRYCKMTT